MVPLGSTEAEQCATSGKPSTWLPLGRLVEQATVPHTSLFVFESDICETSGKPSTWLPLGGLVEQAEVPPRM